MSIQIQIEKTKVTNLKNIDFSNLPFGKYNTDHMFEVDCIKGVWQEPKIRPFQQLHFHPNLITLHYGQAIFEGIKAYKNKQGESFIFRPEDNFKRFNLSAQRMCMPEVPEEIFMEGMRKLIEVDIDWIPTQDNHSLYIRPFMFATDEVLGVKAAETYKFMIILGPVGPYYAKPMRIKVEEHYVRAVEGGTGFAKCAGNYAGSLYPATKALKEGYDQILWTDAFEHKYVQEVGTMNIFFIINNVAITAGLEQGTILGGVTRASVIELLKDMGIKVEERDLSIDEIAKAYDEGKLNEIFGTGTAATISEVQTLCYGTKEMKLDLSTWTIAPKLKQMFIDIREGKIKEKTKWLYKI